MLIATADTAYLLDTTSRVAEPAAIYSGARIRAITMWGETPVIALDGGTVVILRDGSPSKHDTGIKDEIASVAIVPGERPRLLIGTEPPYVYTWDMGGSPAGRNESFATLECRSKWYTPWGGPAAVRSLAITPDGWAYADIHVGSIMRSRDGGEAWAPVTPELHQDVHQVGTSPAAPERVYANTANGVWVSEDRGKSWTHRAEERRRYGRAIAIHPSNSELLLCTVSNGPHGSNVHGGLYRSADAGRSWTHVADGFPPATQANINTFHVVFDDGGTAWACVGNVLYRGGAGADQWREFWRATDGILLLAA